MATALLNAPPVTPPSAAEAVPVSPASPIK